MTARKALAGAVKDAEVVRRVLMHTPEMGVNYEDVLAAEYWTHAASKLHPGCHIEVVPEDAIWFAELFVTAVGRNWATVTPLRFVELAEQPKPAEAADKFSIEWKGQNKKHCVIRKSDSSLIKEGFQDKKSAQLWLDEYEVRVLV